MRIGYLINQYPKVSHTFIRREIAGVEAGGVEVCRFAIRNSTDTLRDPADMQELDRTRWIVKASAGEILASIFTVLIRPTQLFAAIRLMWSLARQSRSGIAKHTAYLIEAMILRRWCAAEKLPHIHAHFGTNATAVAMLCHALGGPTYSFTVHGPEEFDGPEALGLAQKIRNAAFVVAISDFGRSQLLRWCAPWEWSKIKVIRCGLEAEDLDHVATLPQGNRFVIVGRLSIEKGHPILLQACRRLKDLKVPFEVIVVGGGPLRPGLEEMIGELELSDCVRLVGYQSGAEVRQWIESSRATVLPSFAEGLPVVLMESLALGRPVIATYIAGTPELVEPGGNGWLVPAGSVDALTGAMRNALEMSPDQLLTMGKLGQCCVRTRHSQAIEAAKLYSAIRSHLVAAVAVGHETGLPSGQMEPALPVEG